MAPRKNKISDNPRQKKKAELAINGREAAVNYTPQRSYLWYPTADESVNPPAETRREILAIARYLVNNFALCERALTVCENYSVGQGLIFNAATKDKDYNEAATALFDDWATTPFCSHNHSLTFYQMQKLLVREVMTAGEAFIVMTKAESGYPQLMLVRSEDVRHSGLKDDNSVDGILYDDYGRAVQYTVGIGKKYTKVDAANVIHLFRPKAIGQLRGTSEFESGLNNIRDIKNLQDLEKKAVKTHSSMAVAVTRKSGQAGDGLFGDITPVAPNSTNPAYYTKGLEKVFPGANLVFEEGEKIELLASNRSTDGWHAFIESLMRQVCLSLSLPYELLINSEDLSGTGIRFVISDASNFIGNLQTLLVDSALRRVYTWVISSFIKQGKLQPPAKGNVPWAVSIVTPTSITVDQSRASNVEISLLQNSLLNYDTFFSQRGKNWREELRQRAEEEKYLSELSAEFGVDVNRLRSLAAGSAPITEQNAEETPSAAQEQPAEEGTRTAKPEEEQGD